MESSQKDTGASTLRARSIFPARSDDSVQTVFRIGELPAQATTSNRSDSSTPQPPSMISCQRIKQFLSANVDEHASHFILMTTAGTLLGHNYSARVPLLRKFCAFAGPTWRLHDTALAQTGKLATEPAAKDGFFQGKVVQFVVNDDDSGLVSMYVDQDDHVGVVVYVKERLLIAALKEKRNLRGETDELAKLIKGLNLEEEDATDAKETEGGATDAKGGTEGAATDGSVEKGGADPEEPSSVQSVESEDETEGKGKEPANEDPKPKKPSKMRILELRAEAIAEALADGELKYFRMPKDFQ
ncbi:hypothetical protein N7G274_002600 [Stereocaulon virgatum]|uniref:RPA43 OB domain-containing protein n=1 Tax=Stereocaulon virgatum TaxID=373712 RepID=A0ABR4AGE4_9LECA